MEGESPELQLGSLSFSYSKGKGGGVSGLGEGGRERQTLPFRPKATHMLEIPVCTGYFKKKNTCL